MRPDNRQASELRSVIFEAGIQKHPPASVMVSFGDTRVLCAVSLEERVPGHRVGSGAGWLTAEYAMLPGSTSDRKRREVNKRDGRSVEIQRLIGRSLRAAVDLQRLGPRTLWVDCDVIQADGSTRCASITGASVALALALRRLADHGVVPRNPPVLREHVAAVSVGIVGGEIVVDLCQREDTGADVDMNVVGTASGHLIEIQGTAEGATFPRDRAAEMIDRALDAITQIAAMQTRAVEITA